MNATAPEHLDRGWFARAVCVGRHELFFPIVGESAFERIGRERSAKRVCATCPVIDDCRTWARAHREPGIWGGENDSERAAAGFRPVTPGLKVSRDVRRAAEREIAASLALGDLTDDQIDAITRLIEGDPTCS